MSDVRGGGEDWSEEVLRFWFEDLRPAQWFRVDPDLDAAITERFGELHRRVRDLPAKADTPRSALAGVIVLDQFSRNMFRGTPQAFTSDPLALARAEAAIEAEFDRYLTGSERQFLYTPFMHSEDLAVQARAVALFQTLDQPREFDFAIRHKAIIDRFGRFPHRNAILGRPSSPEELAFVAEGGSF